MNTASLQFLFMLCRRGLSHASKAFCLALVPSFAFFLLALCGHWSSAEIRGSGEDACLPSFENVCFNSDSFCFPSTSPGFPSKESELELVGSEDVGEFGLFNVSWEIGPRDFKNVVELNRKATSDDLTAEALNSNENFNLQRLTIDSSVGYEHLNIESGNAMTRSLTKVLEAAEPEECVLATWKSQGTNTDVPVPQGREVLLFPMARALLWARVKKALQPVLLAALFMFLSFFSTFPAARSESRSRTPLVQCSKKIKNSSKTGCLLSPGEPEAKGAGGEDLDASEEPKPESLAVRTGKEKGRKRRKKRKGLPEVSSSQSGNSTPASPKQQWPLSPEADRSRLVQNPLVKDANKKDRVLEHSSHKGNKSKPESPSKDCSISKPILLHSATSISGNSFLGSTSRLALQDRAPGPKSCSKKDIQSDKFIYDIWGDHYSGLGSMYKDDDSESFFVRIKNPQNCISAEFCKLIQ